MKIALIAALSAAVLGVGAVQAVDSIGGSSEPASPVASTTEDTTTTEDRTTTTEDKTETSEDRDAREDDGGTETGEDVSGPCDEAEHANDPRCTGAGSGTTTGDDRVDNSGPGSANSGHRPGGDDDAGHDAGDDHGGGREAGDDSSGHGGDSGHGGGRDD